MCMPSEGSAVVTIMFMWIKEMESHQLFPVLLHHSYFVGVERTTYLLSLLLMILSFRACPFSLRCVVFETRET